MTQGNWYVYYDMITETYIVTNNSNEVEAMGPYDLETAREIANNLNE